MPNYLLGEPSFRQAANRLRAESDFDAAIAVITEHDPLGRTNLKASVAASEHPVYAASGEENRLICAAPPHGAPLRRTAHMNASDAKHQAWLACALIGIDLIAWTQTLLLHDQPDPARAEPRTLRYRLLHVAARLVHGGRRVRLKIDRTWRWAHALAAAFDRLHALPTPNS